MQKAFVLLLIFATAIPCFGAAETPTKKVEQVASDSTQVFLNFGSLSAENEIWTHYSDNRHNHMIFSAHRDQAFDKKYLKDTNAAGTEVFCIMIAYRFFKEDGPLIYLKKQTACSCAEITLHQLDLAKMPLLETHQLYVLSASQQLFVRLTKDAFEKLQSSHHSSCQIC